jgi:hypothetical protein
MNQRTETFPYVGGRCSSDAFFDDSIQRVSLKRRNPYSIPSGLWEDGTRFDGLEISSLGNLERNLLAAWPIAVYDELNLLATSPLKAERKRFQSFYAQDPFFTMRLLDALTDYMARPQSDWSFERALRSLENTAEDQESILRTLIIDGEAVPAPSYNLVSWETVADSIAANFPQHRERCRMHAKSSGPYDHIRKAASKVRDKMNKCLRLWVGNWAAYEQLPLETWDAPCSVDGFTICSFFSELRDPSPKSRNKRDG